MKKFLLIAVCMFSTLVAAAQTKVTWSLELGLGMSTWMGKDADGSNPLFNPKVGVGIDVPLTGLVSFQTGLSWVSKGASYDAGTAGEKVKVDQNYFEMPLLAAFHVGTACKFDMVFTAGPYLAYGVNGKTSTEAEGITVSCDTFDDVEAIGKDGLHRFDAGLQGGVALDFPEWTVGLDVEFGLCKIADGASPRNLAFFFTVGYKF